MTLNLYIYFTSYTYEFDKSQKGLEYLYFKSGTQENPVKRS